MIKNLSTLNIFYHIFWFFNNFYVKINLDKPLPRFANNDFCRYWALSMKNKVNPLVIIIFGAFLALSVFTAFSYLDPDLGWHLRLGQDIDRQGQVPHFNQYNLLLENARWVDHEWLANWLSYKIYDLAGFFSLALVFAGLAVLVWLILFIIINKYYLKYRYVPAQGLLLAYGLYAASPSLGIRIQELTLLGLVLLLFILKAYELKKNPKILLWCLPLFWLWANLHAGFLIGLAVLTAVVFYWLVKFIWSKLIDKPSDNLNFTIFPFLCLGLSLALTFLTPYGIELYDFLGHYSDTAYTKTIYEWMPAWSYPLMLHHNIYLAIFGSAWFYYIWEQRRQGLVRNFFQIFSWEFWLAGGFMVLAFWSHRHFPLFFLASAVWLAQFLRGRLDLPGRLRQLFCDNKLLKILFYSFSTVSLTAILVSANINNSPWQNQQFCRKFPCQAVNFLKQQDMGGIRMYNKFSWGGYLSWVWPEEKTFIDGRLPIYPYEDHTFLAEYQSIYSAEDPIQRLNDHNINTVLFKAPLPSRIKWIDRLVFRRVLERTNQNHIKFYNKLKADPDWELAFEDKTAVVFFKKQ